MTGEIRAPFKFLDPYTKADRDIFFGRDREIDELFSRLLASGLLLIYGVSGSGKTSLVQCSLGDKLEAADGLIVTVRRGSNILEALDAELGRHAVTPLPSDAPLGKRVRSLYLDHFKPIHLVFDQIEELFIFGDREERRAFGLALKELSTLERDLRLILVVREEYLGAMTELEPLLPELFRNRMRVERMDRVQAREAIEGPCRQCGVEIEPELAEEIPTRLAPAEATVELTYLQVVMDRLYRQAAEQAPERPALTRAGLAALGRLDNVLGRFLEEQLAALDNPLAGEALLKAMVSGDGTRRPMTLEAIAQTGTVRALNLSGDDLQTLIQHLIAARILSDRDAHGSYELRHDSLARKVWERMSAREKELLEIRQTIEIRYRDYRRRGLLLDADTLTYLAAYEDGLLLPPEQAAFVKASREAAERKRRRRLTLAFSTLILVLLVVSGLGGLAYLQAREARHQAAEASQQRAEAKRQADRAEQQAAEAARKEKDARHNLGLALVEKAEGAVADKRFNEARLYALHALADLDPQRPGPERATGIVLSNPIYPPGFTSVSSAYHDGPISSVRYSPDGRILASSGGYRDKTIRLWDVATGKEKAVLTGHAGTVASLSFSPDGQTLASGSEDKTIRLWDVATRKETGVLVDHAGSLSNVSFSPDGRTLASGSDDNTIRLWNLTFDRDPRPIEQQIQAVERQYKLHLVNLELASIPTERNLYGVRPEPPIWPEFHPLHWLQAAESGDGHAMPDLGLIYDRADDLPRAETWYRKAAEAGEPTARERLDNVLRQKAVALWETLPQGDIAEAQYDQVLDLCNQVIALDPSHVSAHWVRGQILEAREETHQAEADFRRVIFLQPSVADAYGNLGWLLIKQGRFEEALPVTQKAHELGPTQMALALNLGHVYLLTGDRQTAQEYYEKSLPLIPDEAVLTSGPLADFALFIAKGWQPDACREEADWFRRRFAERQAETLDTQKAAPATSN